MRSHDDSLRSRGEIAWIICLDVDAQVEVAMEALGCKEEHLGDLPVAKDGLYAPHRVVCIARRRLRKVQRAFYRSRGTSDVQRPCLMDCQSHRRSGRSQDVGFRFSRTIS